MMKKIILLVLAYLVVAGRSSASEVCLQGKVVTAVFSDCFYVEETDRSSGIAIVKDTSLSVDVREGYLVTLYGGCQTWPSGERFLLANRVIVLGTQELSFMKLGMTNKLVGGGSLTFTVGPTGGAGINNVGLLVSVWGQVKTVEEGCFFISDGSLPVDLKITSEDMVQSEVGSFVIVTGISSLEATLQGPQRLVRARCQDDIVSR